MFATSILAIIDRSLPGPCLKQISHRRTSRILELFGSIGLCSESNDICYFCFYIGTDIETFHACIIQCTRIILITQRKQISGILATSRHIDTIFLIKGGFKQNLCPVCIRVCQPVWNLLPCNRIRIDSVRIQISLTPFFNTFKAIIWCIGSRVGIQLSNIVQLHEIGRT